MPVILATEKAEIRRSIIGSQPRQTVLETMIQVVESLPTKSEALSSNPSTAPKKEKKKIKKIKTTH
jgi:hypothetical protein